MRIGIDKGYRSRKYVVAAKNMKIPYKLLDCTASNVMEQLKSVDALIWHWTQDSYIDKRIAVHIIRSAELMGKKVYPNIDTCWMFDDKISEKYILEAVGAPYVESIVFFDRKSAFNWLRKQKFPVVYKLPQGAGSINVRLINNEKEAEQVCRMHFSFWGRPSMGMRLYYADRNIFGKIFLETFWNERYRYEDNNKGYILFQRFVPGNAYDVRVTIIGERGIIYRRGVRDNDFRASGSGKIDYNVSKQDIQAIPIARRISRLINSQTMTYDFLYDGEELKIVEMSYGFVAKSVHDAPGWYDPEMNFHSESTDVHKLVIRNLIEE